MNEISLLDELASLNNQITKRIRCDYNLLEQDIMKLRKQNVLNELEILKLTGKLCIFENQEEIAAKVIALFKNRKIINIMVVSKTQSGKTGSMCASIRKYLEDTSNLIPIDHIYIITGLSSCEWKEQTKERMPESIQSRVFHRMELPNTFVDEILGKKNILIIMDEIQVAAKKGQTIYKTFKKANLLNKSSLYENDIKILEYTATPDGTIYDLMKWNEASAKILAEPGDGYVSSYDLLQMGRVKEYKDLCGCDKPQCRLCDEEEILGNIREIEQDINGYHIPLFHIIRTRNGPEQAQTIQNFRKIFSEDLFRFITYDGESQIADINELLSGQIEKHTFIFIKEMLRCAKTLKKKQIGILYDRYTKNPDDATIIQGLVGRDTGYDNNGLSITYTHIESIEKYEELWNSGFENVSIKWVSKTTKFANGALSGSNTFLDPLSYGSANRNDSSIVEVEEPPQPIIKRKTQQEIKKWFIEHLKPKNYGNGPHIKEMNEDGFYTCITQFDKEKKIRTTHEMEKLEKDKKWGFRGNTELSKQKNKFRVYPVYHSETDKTSLEWWLVYY